jgi:sRNA-binding protein
MTISNDQINAVVARLAAAFPQTFVLEKHLAHRPLKIGIAADLRAALPELPSRGLARALAAYAKRIMYLQALTAGAPRVDLRRQSGRRGDRLGSRSRQLRSGQHHGFA